MPTTTRLEHEKIFFHCVCFIEKSECNDGTGEMCTMLQLNKVVTILDIICLDDENMKEIYKMKGNKKQRIHLTISQRNSLKFILYYNTKQC